MEVVAAQGRRRQPSIPVVQQQWKALVPLEKPDQPTPQVILTK